MSDSRQRWRLIVARGAAARDLAHRDVQSLLESGLRAAGLPLTVSEGARPRPRIVFAAPLPVGMRAEHELIDVVLAERVPIHVAREGAARALPPGYELIDLFDVWVGAPSLSGEVEAAEYRVEMEATDASLPVHAAVLNAVAEFLAAPHVATSRVKPGGSVLVDIRPHVLDLRAAAAPPADASIEDASIEDASIELWMRLRLGGDGGVGRPEEVVAAVGDILGGTLQVREVVRERIILRGGSEG